MDDLLYTQSASRRPSGTPSLMDFNALECKMAATSDVPPEIVHHILAHVGRDPKTLSACSLVCRSWMVEATPFVFKELSVNQSIVSLDAFLHFLQSSPHVCKLVEKLTIHSEVDWTRLSRIVRQLPRLHHLKVDVGTLADFPSQEQAGVDVLFQESDLPLLRLQTLELAVSTRLGKRRVSLVLCLFEHIEHLDLLLDRSFHHGPAGASLTAPRKASVRSIYIHPPRHSTNLGDLELLIPSLDVTALQRLTICKGWKCHVFLTQLRRLGGDLTELNMAELTLIELTSPPHFANLTKFGGHIPLHADYGVMAWDCALATLCRALPSLREIYFHVGPFSGTHAVRSVKEVEACLALLNYRRLAEVIEENCPQLDTLSLRVSNIADVYMSFEELKVLLLSLFPAAGRAREVLTFSIGAPEWDAESN